MPKLYDAGGQIDQMTCRICNRTFRADFRTANKLMKLHLLKEHQVTKPHGPTQPDSITYTTNPKNVIVKPS